MSQVSPTSPSFQTRYRCKNPVTQCFVCRYGYTSLRHLSDEDLLIKHGTYPVKFLRNMPIPQEHGQFEERLKGVLEMRLQHYLGQHVKVHVYTFPSPAQAVAVNATSIQARVMVDFPRILAMSQPLMQAIFSGLDNQDWDWHVIAPHPNSCWSAFRMDWLNSKGATAQNFI